MDDPVIELRRYRLHPGRREDLISLFEREFRAPQEALGLQVLGTFRDLERRDAFVWLRGFSAYARRASALAAFYGGPAWLRHRDAANATMVDSDDVLMLAPLRAADHGAGLWAVRALPAGRGAVGAWICPLAAATTGDRARLATWADLAAAAFAENGTPLTAAWLTDPRPNDYPRLPVRTDLRCAVLFAGFADAEALALHEALLEGSGAWQGARRALAAPPSVLRLAPVEATLPVLEAHA